MAIVLPQGRLNNTNDLYIRNFLLTHARILAVVGLHGNTFKPHTGTKTSVVFLQKYTDDELDEIRSVQSRHAKEWNRHLEEVCALTEKNNVAEDELSPLLLAYLQSEFEEPENGENEAVENTEDEDADEELTERISDLETQLASMKGRAIGKAELKRAIAETRRKLAARSLMGQLQWLLNHEALLVHYREAWLANNTAEELDYPIFFAVSEKGGKDNSGEPIYKKEASGELMLDNHGHLIIEHDLDEIANAFIAFAKEQGYEFC